MKPKPLILFLSLGHGLNDLFAGYLLASLTSNGLSWEVVGISVVMYNLVAFGGQYPVAVWMEKVKQHKLFLLTACILNVTALLLYTSSPLITIVCAGIGSAIYHVAGGTVCATQNKSTHIGLFAAPGVAGLIMGGYLAYIQASILTELSIAATLFFLLLLLLKIKVTEGKEISPAKKETGLDQHDIIMLLLLTAIAFRSAIWNIFQLLHTHQYDWLLWIAAAAVIGKIVGGWLADRIGWKLYAIVSILAAIPFLTLFRKEIVLFCVGIGLLQSGIPATTSLLIHSLGEKKEKGIALSFGTAIIIGAFVFFDPFIRMAASSISVIGIAIVVAIAILVATYLLNNWKKQLL